jgi:hypothetical protein
LQVTAALASYDRALATKPDSDKASTIAASRQQLAHRGRSCGFAHALAVNPNSADAWNNQRLFCKS